MKIYILKADAENSNGTEATPYATRVEAVTRGIEIIREWELPPAKEHDQILALERDGNAEGRNSDWVAITEHDMVVPGGGQ